VEKDGHTSSSAISIWHIPLAVFAVSAEVDNHIPQDALHKERIRKPIQIY